MVYHSIWYYIQNPVYAGWGENREIVEVPPKKELADFIKSSEDDTFVFILGKQNGDLASFEAWLTQYDLHKFVVLKTKGITNPVHPDRLSNLFLFVLQSEKHFQREDVKEKTE